LDKSKIYENIVQNDRSIISLLSPFEANLRRKLKIPAKLIYVRKISNDRHRIAHASTSTVDKQRFLINQMRNEVFPTQYEHGLIVKQMVKFLEDLDIDLNNTKLKDILSGIYFM